MMKIAMLLPAAHGSGQEHAFPSWAALFEGLSRSHAIHPFAVPASSFALTRWRHERALLQRLGASGRFDVIHAFLAEPAGQAAVRVGRQLDIPVVVTCDGGEFASVPRIKYGSQRTRQGQRAVRDACAMAARVHVCSSFMAALAHQRGISTTVIPLTSVTSAAARIKWLPSRREKNQFRLIAIGSLSRLKNQRLLIDALPIVRETLDVHVDVVGRDTLDGELQRHAAMRGVDAHITFHGYQPQERVHELLTSADLYVQTSLHEAAGAAVLEAAAHGVPTVGTLTGYVADWSPTKAVAVGDAIPESLADAIVTLLADADRRRSIAALARTFAIAHDAAWAAAQFDRLYRGLV